MKRIKRNHVYRDTKKEKIFVPAKVLSTTIISGPTTTKGRYHNFLKSAYWRDLRRKRLRKDKKCYICLTRSDLQIHHNGYKDAFDSRKTKALKNTYVLCGGCHGAVHKIQKARGLKWEETKPIIEGLKTNATHARREMKEREYEFMQLAKQF